MHNVLIARRGVVWVLLLTFLLPAGLAHAHKFRCFATVDGTTVSGYAWFGGGTRPKNIPYKVLAPDGKVLHKGTTNEKGEYSFEAPARCDLELVVDGGEGHQARFTVNADQLPAALPAYGSEGGGGTTEAEAAPGQEEENPPAEEVEARAEVDSGALRSVVSGAVNKAVAPLRVELQTFKEETRMQDVLGGIGYLFGLAGLAFYFLGVRRKESGK